MSDIEYYRGMLSGITPQGKLRRANDRKRQLERESDQERYKDAKTRIRNGAALLDYTGERIILTDAKNNYLAPFISPMAENQLRGLQGMIGVIGTAVSFDYKDGV